MHDTKLSFIPWLVIALALLALGGLGVFAAAVRQSQPLQANQLSLEKPNEFKAGSIKVVVPPITKHSQDKLVVSNILPSTNSGIIGQTLSASEQSNGSQKHSQSLDSCGQSGYGQPGYYGYDGAIVVQPSDQIFAAVSQNTFIQSTTSLHAAFWLPSGELLPDTIYISIQKYSQQTEKADLDAFFGNNAAIITQVMVKDYQTDQLSVKICNKQETDNGTSYGLTVTFNNPSLFDLANGKIPQGSRVLIGLVAARDNSLVPLNFHLEDYGSGQYTFASHTTGVGYSFQSDWWALMANMLTMDVNE